MQINWIRFNLNSESNKTIFLCLEISMTPNTMMYVSNLEIAIGTTKANSQGFTVIIKQSQTKKTDYQNQSHRFLNLWAGVRCSLLHKTNYLIMLRLHKGKTPPILTLVNQKPIRVLRFYILYTESIRQQKGLLFQLILFSLHAPRKFGCILCSQVSST